MSELPRPLQQAIRRHLGRGGRIEEITRSTEDGEVSHDLEPMPKP